MRASAVSWATPNERPRAPRIPVRDASAAVEVRLELPYGTANANQVRKTVAGVNLVAL